jgi:hypothetical protein
MAYPVYPCLYLAFEHVKIQKLGKKIVCMLLCKCVNKKTEGKKEFVF